MVERQTAARSTPPGRIAVTTAGEVLETCRAVAGSDAALTWVDESFLREHEVGEWMELPLWLAREGEDANLHTADIGRAVAAGLATRPIDETVRDTLAWASARDGRGAGTAAMGTTEGVGLEPEKERRLLAEWHAQA